jgi:hypothetical protein
MERDHRKVKFWENAAARSLCQYIPNLTLPIYEKANPQPGKDQRLDHLLSWKTAREFHMETDWNNRQKYDQVISSDGVEAKASEPE